jgi:hypothetical protein
MRLACVVREKTDAHGGRCPAKRQRALEAPRKAG